MGTLSMFHWFIVAIVVLLLFGNRLPSVMRSLGRGVVEFKKGLAGIEDDLNESVNKHIEDSASRKRDETSPQKQEEPVAKEATQSKSV